ncbi:MAG: methyltransferase domain-containing protein [Desulfovibrio sp.]|jgi:SAM-dependent methyltransferase|nr:methyltransferase domain-containing protein [Desulfovibrio sp.]
MSYWKNYWSTRTNGGHRHQDEDWLRAEAEEKLLLCGEKRGELLDFGCDSADILAYLAPYFMQVAGVDFSPTMLENARNRLKSFSVSNATLFESDDAGLENALRDRMVDTIIAVEVAQYFTNEKLGRLVGAFRRLLRDRGRIVLAGCIDPFLFPLWSSGFFVKEEFSLCRLIWQYLLYLCREMKRKLKGMPGQNIGYGHSRETVERIAGENGLRAEFRRSMFYEYRYHVIFSAVTHG